MKKMIFLAALAAFFVSGACAADVVPNHIRHPLHAAVVKMLAPKSVVRMGATAATAASSSTPAPTLAPGGLSNENLIAGLSWSALLGDTATYADNSVQQTDIGATVAGLDGAGNVTSGVLSGKIVSGPTVAGDTVPTTYTYINPQSTDTMSGKGPFYWWDGYSAAKFGGTPVTLAHSPYGNQAGTVQNLILNYAPGGGFNAGCSLCIFMEPSSIQQAAVSAVATAQTGGIPTADAVGIFEHPTNARFDLLLPVASYTATSVVLSGTLSATELSHIQPLMTIFTNSQIPGKTPTNPEDADYYMGVIQSVATANGVTTITVAGWGAQGTTSSGAVPSTTSLETTFWANQTSPVVGIGGYNKAFARNEFMAYDGNYAGDGGSAATSLVRSFSGDEMDMIVSNATKANSLKVGFYVTNLAMSPDHTNVLTHDSFGFYAGGNTPHHFWAGDSCYIDGSGYYDQSAFEGAATWIGGSCQLGALETALKRYDQEVAEFDGRTTGSNDFRLMYHIAEAAQGQGTMATNVRPKLGIVIGGEHGAGVDSGSVQADLEWNQGGNYGGLAICGNGENCGFLVDSAGVPHAAPYGLSSGNGYTIGTQPSGHAAMFGAYAASGYAANLLELMVGSSVEASLSAAGDLTVAGNVSTGADGQILIPAATTTGAGVGNYLTTDGVAKLTVHAVNGGTSGLAAGNLFASNSLTVGSVPSGYTALAGIYASTGYTNDLLELMVGSDSKAVISSAGDLTIAGNLNTGANKQLVLSSAASVGAGTGAYLLTNGYADAELRASNGGAATYSAEQFRLLTGPGATSYLQIGTDSALGEAVFTNKAGTGVLLAAEGSISSDAGRILASIKAGSYTESTRLWCHDCRNSGQVAGSGTGRWISLDSAGTWRSDDGVEAVN
ncbi:hypothetical protein [Gluconobacter japonicus]|uniref:hypothetical protein n=1 Tax=Gluconobacter japonicus TaxID=376620 RepID=UPI0007862C54|nr:hypothetical protein [Gluconobacter japonicus]KXV20661.1 hypothetical protein AD935_11325 [Gluconobacter japonicus]